VVSACEGDEGAMMSEQPTDRTAGTEEATKPGGRDQWYGHLTVEDDPEGTTDEAEPQSNGVVDAERSPFGRPDCRPWARPSLSGAGGRIQGVS
jgi:hypothetical protein